MIAVSLLFMDILLITNFCRSPANTARGRRAALQGCSLRKRVTMDAQPATGARKAVDTAFYDLFDLSPDATSAQIKRAYYKRARECHPDKHPNDAVKEAEFKKLSQAYQTLFDEERRAVYDAFGRDGMQSDESYADPKQVFAAVFGDP